MGRSFRCANWGGASLREPVLHMPSFTLIFLGITGGVFYGMLAAALTEVLNVFPILVKRIRLDGEIAILIMAIVLGKILDLLPMGLLCSSLKLLKTV